jgi:hypothetical protein
LFLFSIQGCSHLLRAICDDKPFIDTLELAFTRVL